MSSAEAGNCAAGCAFLTGYAGTYLTSIGSSKETCRCEAACRSKGVFLTTLISH